MKSMKRILSMMLAFLMLFVQAVPAEAGEQNDMPYDNMLNMYVGDIETLNLPEADGGMFTWSTSKKSVARVSASGEVTARKAGRATIKAVNESGDKTYKWNVTVKKVALENRKLTIICGKTGVVRLEGADIAAVKSSKPKVATVAEDGTITAVKVGSASIKVTSDKGKKYTCSVKVKPGLDNAEVTLAKDDTAKITLNGAKVKTVKSDNPSVAEITKEGEITGKEKGTAKLTVTDTKKKKYVCEVKVEMPSLNESSLNMNIGDTFPLLLHYNTQDVSWSSNNDSIVNVTSDGEVTAREDGSAEITAVVASGSSYTCAVNVKEKEIIPPDEPEEKPAELTLEAGQTELSAGKGSQTVSFSARINAKVSSIALYHKNSGEKAGELLDNGALAENGDEKADDGIYSAKLDLNPDTDQAESYSFYAQTEVNGEKVTSKDVIIKVIPEVVSPVPAGPDLTLSSTQKEMSVGSSCDVYFSVKVNAKADSIALYNKADNKKVSDMWDDGLYKVHGDDIPNDGVYSAKISLTSDSAADFCYYAEAVVNGQKKISNDYTIKVYQQLSAQEIKQMESVDDDLKSTFKDSGYQNMTEEQKIEKVGEILSDLEKNNQIQPGSVCFDEESGNYSFIYNCGVIGVVSIRKLEENFDAAGAAAADKDSEQIEVISGLTESEDVNEIQENAETETPETVSENTSGNQKAEKELTEDEKKQALIDQRAQQAEEAKKMTKDRVPVDMDDLPMDSASDKPVAKASILYSRDDFTSIYSGYWKDIKKDLESNNVVVDMNEKVLTAEDYKTAFAGKDLVMIHSHGSRVSIDYTTYSAVCLREPVSAAGDEKYKDDLKTNRLIRALTDEGSYYWVLPSFFSYYYSGSAQINDAIVYMGMCLGAGEGSQVDYTLEAELQKAGAAAVMAYHNSVYTQYNVTMAQTIVDELMKGEDVGTAVENAKNKIGKTDSEWASNHGVYVGSHPAATLILDGRREKTLLHSGLLNGSFEETGIISGSKWKYVGDARILTQLAELTPRDGSQMAIISTGLGSAEAFYKGGTEGSCIYQYFKVPFGAEKITFTYDVVSEEPMEWVGSAFDDWFEVQLLDKSGKQLTAKPLVRENVNDSKWFSIDNIDFEGGDNTTYHTDWKTMSADISAYEGEYIAIRFIVSDVGDSIYDTAVLIDNVYVDGVYLQ